MLSRCKTQYVSGMSDSPTWKRGNCSRSNSSTRRPCWPSSDETVDPAGPPPMTMMSVSGGDAMLNSLTPIAVRRLVRRPGLVQQLDQLTQLFLFHVSQLPRVTLTQRLGDFFEQFQPGVRL